MSIRVLFYFFRLQPHFKALFQPKAVFEDDVSPPVRPEVIIRESQPVELPPDVVRGSLHKHLIAFSSLSLRFWSLYTVSSVSVLHSPLFLSFYAALNFLLIVKLFSFN